MSNRKISPFQSQQTRNRLAKAVIASLLLFILSGCGGGSNNPPNQTSNRSARVQALVQWPAYQAARAVNGRYIPAYAQSLFLELYPTNAPATRYRISADRPDDKPSVQTVAFNQLIPAGNYTLAAVARIEKAGQGATVASAATSVVVEEGKTFSVDITLATTLKTLAIQSQPLSVSTGSVLSLVGQALDPDGKIVLLPVGALTWKLVSGSAFGAVTTDGAFTAVSPGTARVRLSEDGAGVSSEADVTITGTVINNNGGLANSSWPKANGDIANTGRSNATGATGVLGWNYLDVSGTAFGNAIINGGVSVGTDGTLYVGINIPGTNRMLSALDGKTGMEKWQVPVSRGAYQPTIGADGTIYSGDYDGKVSALDGKTGASKWSFQTAEGLGYIPSMNIGADGTIYVNNGFGYALDGKTGVQKWRVDPGTLTALNLGSNPPAIGPLNTIYFGTNDRLFAVDGITGAILWKDSSPNNIVGGFTTPCVGSDGTVYCVHTGLPSVLYAYNGRTGAKKWQFIIQSDLDVGSGSPAIAADGTIYVVGRNKLVALEPAVGAVKWMKTGLVIGQGQTPLIGVDGTIYVYSVFLNSFNPIDGSVIFNVRSRVNDASGAHGLSIGPDGSLYGVTGLNIYQIK